MLVASQATYILTSASSIDYRELIEAQKLRLSSGESESDQAIVRLHAIGTPSTRPGPDRWLLEARHHAPLIASFLSPQATRKAWSFWDHNEDCSMMDLKWTQDYMYGSPLDW